MSFDRLGEEDKKRFSGHADTLAQLVNQSFEGKTTDFLNGVVESMNVIEAMIRMVRQEIDIELIRRRPKSPSSRKGQAIRTSA